MDNFQLWTPIAVAYLTILCQVLRTAFVLHHYQTTNDYAHNLDTQTHSCSELSPTPIAIATKCYKTGARVKRTLTGMLTFLNISAPRRASSRAISCGVVTKTAPVHIGKQLH